MTDEAQAEKDLDSTVLRLLLDTREPWSMLSDPSSNRSSNPSSIPSSN